jgi:putative PIG3 family NAD(P)H quinone oxidoreductase
MQRRADLARRRGAQQRGLVGDRFAMTGFALIVPARTSEGASVIPNEMRYVEATRTGGPDVLALKSGPVPQPGAGEVLVKVAAAGVNRSDVAQRQGHYPPPPGASPILGLEIAGTIAALGRDAGSWSEGDVVCAVVAGGGYAEYCLAPAPQCLPVPNGLTPLEAAAIPEAFFTVWDNVFERGRLAAGESLLVHGGASGVGTAAIQLARARGARVFATAGSDAKCEACKGLGAEAAINYRAADFVSAVRDLTEGRGVDVILDMVGGAYLARNLEALASGGRLVQIAFQQGSEVTINLLPLILKRLTLTGSTLRARSIAEKAAIAAALREKVWPLFEAGTVKPVVFASFPLAEADAAHRRFELGVHIGKIMLTTAARTRAEERAAGEAAAAPQPTG